MGATKDLFIRMTEEEYLAIPHEIIERHLSSKVYSQSVNDFDELMKHQEYRDAYQMNKESKKHLEEITYLIREHNRKSITKN